MKIFNLFVIILLIFQINADLFNNNESSDIFKGEEWTSGEVSLENNGDFIFYFLFKARESYPQKKLLIWLNGGPGCSSEIGMLTENGPYLFDKTLKLKYNEFAWNKYYDIIYVDQPVGTMYSSVKDQAHYCRNETCVAQNFAIFLRNFVTIHHPEYQGIPIYIAGESYAGHFIPAIIAHLVKTADKNIVNLQGAAIGNGLTDVAVQFPVYPDFVLDNKMLNVFVYVIMKGLAMVCNIALAHDLRIFDPLCVSTLYVIGGAADVKNYYDIRRNDTDYDIDAEVIKFLNNKTHQKLFGVKERNITELCDGPTHEIMYGDWCTPVTKDIAYVLDMGLKVLLYYGDKDYICNWYGGEALANKIEWSGMEEYHREQYKDIEYKGKISARYKKYGKFTFMIVKDAGHMVPGDQKDFSLHMIKSFVENEDIFK